ncbi:hypothetical protein IC63_09075 [Paracoccus sphaerophysae]|uniref:Uncharacterized protein n=1 Tax=Paracoccus sphaerophysae TaxID=690417 RepID=A0A099FAG8_9RHOB|nr:hypothetical protein IC63_09075 [Paracoccus sphaerophysae]
MRKIHHRCPDPLIAQQSRHVGNRSAPKFEASPFLFSDPLALSDSFPGRSWYWLTVRRRPIALFTPEQLFQTDTFTADLHAAVYLDPDFRSCIDARCNPMQRHYYVFIRVRNVCEEPADWPTIEVRQSRKFHGGYRAVPSFDLRDSRTGKAKSFSHVTLTD